MLDALNAVFLAATIANQALNVVAVASQDVMAQENVKVYSVSMKQQVPMWADRCLYDGVMVRYARDWEETEEATGAKLPPEPDRPIGYALILTKAMCPGEEARKIFNTGSKYFYPLFGKDYVIREGHRIDTFDFAGLRDDIRPKWMEQVIMTIESEAGRNNPAARDFMVELAARLGAAEKGTEQAKRQ